MYTKSSTSAVKCEKVRSTPCPDGADPNGSSDATGRDARHEKSHFPKVMSLQWLRDFEQLYISTD